MAQRIGIHFVCRDDLGVTRLPNARFESRAWRVAEKTARTAEYVALHQGQGEQSYRQGRIITYRRDAKRPEPICVRLRDRRQEPPMAGPDTRRADYGDQQTISQIDAAEAFRWVSR